MDPLELAEPQWNSFERIWVQWMKKRWTLGLSVCISGTTPGIGLAAFVVGGCGGGVDC